MPGRTTLFHLLLVTILSAFFTCSYTYQMYPMGSSSYEDRRHIYRHEADNKPSEEIARIPSDIFGSEDDSNEKSSRLQDESESSLSPEELSILEMSHSSPTMSKRTRKGPTLSVVNPLEVLRQRLMLDLARRRIQENQQQIVANAQLLENIGKRSDIGSGVRNFHN